jgi:acetylornithine deacetylase/succinyl-diaminopimelate desuccinylase family protein
MATCDEYVIDVLKNLIRVPSFNPPGNEKKIAECIKGILKKTDIPAEVEPVGNNRANVTGILRGDATGPVLVLNGHLDTVPVKEGWDHDPFSGETYGDKIYGRGAADMKGAIAAMIGAAKRIQESKDKIKGSLLLSFVADEERKNVGTIRFLEKYKDIDYAVVGEPSDLDIVISNRGVLRLEISTYGKAGHASNPSGGINAIYQMNKAISSLMELAESYGSNTKNYTNKPSLSVSLIKGGTAENIIPDTCEIIIDRRTVYHENTEEVIKEITGRFEEIRRKDSTFDYSYKVTEELGPWKTRDDSGLLKMADRIYQGCFNKKPVLKDLGASCETTLFAEKGADTMVFGPGSIKQAHTKDEYVEISQLKGACEYYYRLIKEVLS